MGPTAIWHSADLHWIVHAGALPNFSVVKIACKRLFAQLQIGKVKIFQAGQIIPKYTPIDCLVSVNVYFVEQALLLTSIFAGGYRVYCKICGSCQNHVACEQQRHGSVSSFAHW